MQVFRHFVVSSGAAPPWGLRVQILTVSVSWFVFCNLCFTTEANESYKNKNKGMGQVSSMPPEWNSGCLRGARQILIAELRTIQAQLTLWCSSLRQPAVSEVWEEERVWLRMGLWVLGSLQAALSSSQDASTWSSCLGSAIQREF